LLEVLTENFVSLLASMKIEYRRYFADTIDMSAKLVGIVGPRGVGKTTFILQYLKSLDIPVSKKLYFSADSIEIADYSLLEIAKRFHALGGEVLAIDEIHKYPDFEKELKSIYDLLDLKVIFSGSSAIRLEHSKADLSRRADLYRVHGLSFREFLELETGETLPRFSLQELVEDHLDIALAINEKIKPLAFWKAYLHYGYYPFYFDNRERYRARLESTVNTVIEVDLPTIFSMKYENVINLKRLVKLVCSSEPFKINIADMSRKIDIDRDTLYLFIDYLSKGSIFKVLRPKSRGDAIFVKPEKLYLHNPNLNYAYCEAPKIGTIRETFAINQIGAVQEIEYPKSGDLLVGQKYLFEIGGKGKGYAQIKDQKCSYVLADDIVSGSGNKIPLWMAGLLY
jgi:predicted AAA+ superfamily ATPase